EWAAARFRGPAGLAARRRSRLLRRREGGVEVDRDAVGIAHERITLAPERVPGLLLALEALAGHAGVDLVHLGRARALEGDRDLVAGLARPVLLEAAHRFLAVEHEPHAVREERVDMALVRRLRHVEPECPVQAARRPPLGGH